MTETGKAQMLGITRARLHALKHRRVEQFSPDALVALAMRLGLTVRMSVTRPRTGAAIEVAASGSPSLLRADASYSVEV